jgi:hypothetical protein
MVLMALVLIDCGDPSCSGYTSCPVLEAGLGGNDGGLSIIDFQNK